VVGQQPRRSASLPAVARPTGMESRRALPAGKQKLQLALPVFFPLSAPPSGVAAGNFLPLGSPIRAPKQCPSLLHFFPAPSSTHSGEPLLAVLHGARRLFDKMRSKPRAAASLPFVLHFPHRVSSLSCSLHSPIRDAVETRGEKTPLPLLLSYFVLGKNC
jgi:hypothetical protein